jgi:hypothetical protein
MLQSEKALLRWRLADDLDREDVSTAIMGSPSTWLWLGRGLYRMERQRVDEAGLDEAGLGDGAYLNVGIAESLRLGPADTDLEYDAWDMCPAPREAFKRSLFLRFAAGPAGLERVFLDVFMEDARAHFSQE